MFPTSSISSSPSFQLASSKAAKEPSFGEQLSSFLMTAGVMQQINKAAYKEGELQKMDPKAQKTHVDAMRKHAEGFAGWAKANLKPKNGTEFTKAEIDAAVKTYVAKYSKPGSSWLKWF